jgi:hypothetical protein
MGVMPRYEGAANRRWPCTGDEGRNAETVNRSIPNAARDGRSTQTKCMEYYERLNVSVVFGGQNIAIFLVLEDRGAVFIFV